VAPKQTGSSSAFFGRRKGKPLRQAQGALLANLLPKLRPLGDRPAIVTKDLWLEIGFGGGEHLTGLASVYPDIQFIGCEPFVNGVAKAVSLIDAHAITNVQIHDDEASVLLANLPPMSVSRVYILYPDPWPKARHRKRRLISEEFLALLARVMKKGSELRFVTDIDDYSAWTLSRIQSSVNFQWLQKHPNEWLSPWEGWISTRYERKALEEGRPPVYLIFERI
jgi:tRNA (guanine-N7-)-methyltransferase